MNKALYILIFIPILYSCKSPAVEEFHGNWIIIDMKCGSENIYPSSAYENAHIELNLTGLKKNEMLTFNAYSNDVILPGFNSYKTLSDYKLEHDTLLIYPKPTPKQEDISIFINDTLAHEDSPAIKQQEQFNDSLLNKVFFQKFIVSKSRNGKKIYLTSPSSKITLINEEEVSKEVIRNLFK